MKRARHDWGIARGICCSLALLGSGCGEAAQDFSEDENVGETSSALTSYATKALLITDLSVVRNSARTSDPCNAVAGDENKVWTLGHLLKKEAEKNGKTANDYVKSWLDAWATTATVNGQSFTPILSALSGPTVRANWAKDAQDNYLLHMAPLKLIAIVNRLDLRTFRPLGEPLGGEIRFVFAPMLSGRPLVTPTPADGRCMTQTDELSTIILEYSPVRSNENAVVDWAKKWHALGSMTMDGSYRTALANLTEEVVNSGRLLRIRTNEGGTGNWKLTEFEHHPTTKLLVRSTIKQSPTEALHTQSSTSLGTWIRDNEAKLQGLKPQPRTFRRPSPVAAYALPDKFPGTNTWLRGGFNNQPSDLSLGFWNATNPGMWQGAWDEARHLFSLQTCNGCHGKETATAFNHIASSNTGAAKLSGFLSGTISVTDPVNSSIVRQFNEMGRREEDLNWLVTDGWVGVPVVRNEHAGGQNAAMNYKLVFLNSSKCLDLEGASQSENGLVKLWSCHGGDNQRLALVDRGQSVTSLMFKHSGKCLDVENGSTANLAKVVQKTCDSNSNSQKVSMWFSASQTGRTFKFQHSNRCIQVQNNSGSDGAQIVQETCPDGTPDNRSFKFVE